MDHPFFLQMCHFETTNYDRLGAVSGHLIMSSEKIKYCQFKALEIENRYHRTNS